MIFRQPGADELMHMTLDHSLGNWVLDCQLQVFSQQPNTRQGRVRLLRWFTKFSLRYRSYQSDSSYRYLIRNDLEHDLSDFQLTPDVINISNLPLEASSLVRTMQGPPIETLPKERHHILCRSCIHAHPSSPWCFHWPALELTVPMNKGEGAWNE